MRIQSCILAATAALLAPLRAQGDDAPTALRFGWVAGQRAVLTWEEEHRDDISRFADPKLRVRAEISVQSDGADGALRVDFGLVEILALADHDMTTDAARRQAGPLVIRVQAGLPSLRVSADGAMLGVEDWDQFAERYKVLLQPMVDRREMPAQMIDGGVRSLAEAKHRERTLRRLAAWWDAWVGAWTGRELQPGKALELDRSDLISAVEVPTHVAFERRGQPGPGLLRAVCTASRGGDELAQAVLAAGEEGRVQGRDHVDLTTTAATLMPIRVVLSQRVDTIGGQTRTRADTYAFDFAWQR